MTRTMDDLKDMSLRELHRIACDGSDDGWDRMAAAGHELELRRNEWAERQVLALERIAGVFGALKDEIDKAAAK